MDRTGRASYVERRARVRESQGEPRIAGRIDAHLTLPAPSRSAS